MKNVIILFFVLLSTLSFAEIPQNGLVFYFPFTGTMADAGPNKIEYQFNTQAGTLNLASDRNHNANSCYSFMGGYMRIGYDNGLTTADSSFTFVAWASASTVDVNTIYSNNYGFMNGLSFGQKGGTFYAAVCGGNFAHSISVNVVNDANYHWYDWHHLAVVLNHSTHLFNVYVDGAKKPINNDTSWGPYGGTITGNDLDFTGLSFNLNPGNNNAIGTYLGNGSSNQRYIGYLDDIALYNRALSEDEIAGIYSGTTTSHENPSKSNPRISLNSVQETLTINGLEKDAKISVFNLTGEKVADCIAHSMQQSLDVSSLPIGIYLVKINYGSTFISEKFIKK